MSPTVSTTDYAAIIDRLERFADGTQDNFPGNTTDLRAVISLLREASNTEPIAWLSIDCIGERYLCFTRPQDNDPAYPLFTHPASPSKPAVVRQSLFMDEERLYTHSTPGFVGQIEAAKKGAEEYPQWMQDAAREAAATLTARDQVRRRWTGPGHLEQTGYIPEGSASEREARRPYGTDTMSEMGIAPMCDAPQPQRRSTEARCIDCGKPYDEFGLDLTLPDNHWNAIRPEGDGLLCANCIVARASKVPGAVAIRAQIDTGEGCAHLREPTDAQIRAARWCMRHNLSSLPTDDDDLDAIVYSTLRAALAARE